MKIQFKLNTASTRMGEHVFIIGNVPDLGEWNPDNAVLLHTNELMHPSWVSTRPVQVTSMIEAENVEYKYFICCVDRANGWKKTNMRWESGENRQLNLADFYQRAAMHHPGSGYEVVVEDLGFNQRGARSGDWPQIKEFSNQMLENSYVSKNQYDEEPHEQQWEIQVTPTPVPKKEVIMMQEKPKMMHHKSERGQIGRKNLVVPHQLEIDSERESVIARNMKQLGKLPQSKNPSGEQDKYKRGDSPARQSSNMSKEIGMLVQEPEELKQKLNPYNINHDDTANFQIEKNESYLKEIVQHMRESSSEVDTIIEKMQGRPGFSRGEIIHPQAPVQTVEYVEKIEMQQKKPVMKVENSSKQVDPPIAQAPRTSSHPNAGSQQQQIAGGPNLRDQEMQRTIAEAQAIAQAQRQAQVKALADAQALIEAQARAKAQVLQEAQAYEAKLDTHPVEDIDLQDVDLEDQNPELHQEELVAPKKQDNPQPRTALIPRLPLPSAPVADQLVTPTSTNSRPQLVQPTSQNTVKEKSEEITGFLMGASSGVKTIEKTDNNTVHEYSSDIMRLNSKTEHPNLHQRKPSEQVNPNNNQDHGQAPMMNETAGEQPSNPSTFTGVVIESMTGPKCEIDDIDDYSEATVGMLKDAMCQCLGLAEWVDRHHLQLFFRGTPLANDQAILSECGISEGSKINYIIMIA